MDCLRVLQVKPGLGLSACANPNQVPSSKMVVSALCGTMWSHGHLDVAASSLYLETLSGS